MFEKDYKNQIESIKPDGYIKDKIRREMAQAQAPKLKKSPVKIWSTAVAAVLCVAILAGVGIWSGRRLQKTETPRSGGDTLPTYESYSGVYKTLGAFKPTIIDEFGNIFNGGIKGEDQVVYEYATDADNIEATEDNAIAKPGASTDKSDFAAKGDSEHSETTTQVEGVDEADLVKTDGRYIYIADKQNYESCTVEIVDIRDGTPKHIFTLKDEQLNADEMYLYKDRLIIIGAFSDPWLAKTDSLYGGYNETLAAVYDVSNPAAPKKIELIRQSGYYNSSRMIGDKLYLISNYNVNVSKMSEGKPESFVPIIECRDYDGAVPADSICVYSNVKRPEYTVVSAYEVKGGKLISSQSVLGGSNTVYASTGNIITAGYAKEDKTQVARFEINDGRIKNSACGELEGTLLNQFSIDEYKGYFRFVLTRNIKKEISWRGSVAYEINPINALVILDGSLKETGKITDIAPDERVYSVRFMGDIAYFVTFRQVDPLFSVDVSDPENPKIIGSLKIPGFSNYLFPYGEGKLLGIGQNADPNTGRSEDMKLSMFDISNPANVTEGSKTDIPSNYSFSFYDHRATLVDYEKNLIGFAAAASDYKMIYYIYSFDNGQFVKRMEYNMGKYYGANIRGLYSGDIFYVATDAGVVYFSMSDFSKLGEIRF